MNYLSIIIIIGILIFIHELGHFIAAKLIGVKIAVFSIGFGPKLYRYKHNETEYRFSVIPLGGYVLPDLKDENEYFKIPVIKRIIFSLGGPLANILLAGLILFLLNIQSAASVTELLIKPFSQLFKYLVMIVLSLANIFNSPDKLSGIFGIVITGAEFINSRIQNAFHLITMLSLNLAVFNLLPIPALDGGKIILGIMEKIHPRFLKAYIPATIAGWILILGLMVYATANDIIKFFA